MFTSQVHFLIALQNIVDEVVWVFASTNFVFNH